AKKVKTTPALLEKLIVRKLKTFKLASTKYVETQTEKFSTPTSLNFSAHRTRSVVRTTLCENLHNLGSNYFENSTLGTTPDTHK
ncbi:MAG: hypothetical protein PHS59_05905, partial [Paludibacter sp.]|nr:hypothetical protein [Paludibacter sp.]